MISFLPPSFWLATLFFAHLIGLIAVCSSIFIAFSTGLGSADLTSIGMSAIATSRRGADSATNDTELSITRTTFTQIRWRLVIAGLTLLITARSDVIKLKRTELITIGSQNHRSEFFFAILAYLYNLLHGVINGLTSPYDAS